MKSYHIEIDNSTSGQIGLCAAVRAKSKKAALKLFLKRFDTLGTFVMVTPDLEYMNIYINLDLITIKDIEEE